jgi:hypothetical protein
MSWSTCYTGSNNIHYNDPPLMMDGRTYASWQPEAVVNKKIQVTENINTNWKYRQYLQKNGRDIMKYNSEEYYYYLGIDPKLGSDNSKTNGNVPFKFKSINDEKKPEYGYSSSNLKTPYLTREQLNSQLISPYISNSNVKKNNL